MKYNVGDKVIIAKKWRSGKQNMEGKMDKWLGKTMTIRKIHDGHYHMIEDNGEGNICDGWAYYEEDIEGLANHKIVITADGKTTTARLFNGKELVRKAEAKCSPDDKFDFVVGAELAMERLIDKKPVNPFKVGDFVRVTGKKTFNHGFDIGSIGRVDKAHEDSCYVYAFTKSGRPFEQWVGIKELEKI